MLPLFFAIGVIFAPIGGLLLWVSSTVQELQIEYSQCSRLAPELKDNNSFRPMDTKYVESAFKSKEPIQAMWAVEKNIMVAGDYGVAVSTNICHLQFRIPDEMHHPVLFYYHLVNFHQNHRRYVDSQDAEQLSGQAKSYSAIQSTKCTPLYGENNLPYYPCGLIANSMFNDTFSSPVLLNPRKNTVRDDPAQNYTKVYQMNNKTNIAWASDKDLYGETKYKIGEMLPPPNWRERFPDGYTKDHPPPPLHEWEAFQVWMRTAGLPSFSKLYQRNDNENLEPGTYEVTINDCKIFFLFV